MAPGQTEPSHASRKRAVWRAGWLGAALVAVAGAVGCSPVTRLYLEQPLQWGGVPPEDVPFLDLSASLAHSAEVLEQSGYRFDPPEILGSTRPEMKWMFSNAAPGVYEASTIRIYFKSAWHRGMFYLLCKDDEVLLVSWHISNMSP